MTNPHMARITAAAITVALGLASALVAAPSAVADEPIWGPDGFVDFSCGPAGGHGQVTFPQGGDETGYWYDAMTGQGLAPANWEQSPRYGRINHINWTQHVPGPAEDVVMGGNIMSAKQRTQIAYIVNRWGAGTGSPERKHLDANYAIRLIADAYPRHACDTETAVRANQMVNDTLTLTGNETGEVDIFTTDTGYDPTMHSYTLTEVDIRDRGSNHSYASAMYSNGGPQISLALDGATFNQNQITSSVAWLWVSNNILSDQPTFYATQPGPVTLTVTTRVPSPHLHLVSALDMATQIRSITGSEATRTVTIQVPKDTLTVDRTITSTTLALEVDGYHPWLTGINTLRAVATPPVGSGLPTVERTWGIESSAPLLTGLTPNTQYTLSVTDIDGYAHENRTAFTTAPAAPTDLRTTPGPTHIGVSWQPSPGATSYEVTVGSTTRTVTGTAAQITGLTPSTAYPVSVQALNLPARGGSVSTSTRTTLPIPGKVSVIRASSNTATLSWPQVPGATRYRLALDGHNGLWEPSASTATLMGLTPGRTYTGTLTALATGETPSLARFTLTTAPSIATGIKVIKSAPTALSLAWRAGSPGTRYTVKVTGKNGQTITTTNPNTTITGLKANSTYKVSVQAANAAGTSAWSPAVTVRTAKKTKAKITAKRSKKKVRVTVAEAPKARIRVQTRTGTKWRTVKKTTAKKNRARITVKASKTVKIRVIVAATTATKKTTKILNR